MGVYDTLPGGQQVKCWWCVMKDVKYGDVVPSLERETNYSIALREGGYANITDLKFISITSKPIHQKIFDKWGDPFDEKESRGIMKEGYLFKRKKGK